jgi:hypothetical protein
MDHRWKAIAFGPLMQAKPQGGMVFLFGWKDLVQ